ncbi:MAG: PqqD family protein [Ruminococcus sp.]|nr:PqqD family protein [Ruminococcus sp.]
MKLNDSFILHDENNEKILVSDGTTKFVGLVHSNATAGFIISCLQKETTEDEIVAKMLKKWDVSEEIARRDVKKIVAQLRKIGAING